MCIRDSGNMELVKSFTNKSGVYHSVDYNLGNYFDLDYIRTVSYTHLRAHETVLDLVCRLLLEKKKNT